MTVWSDAGVRAIGLSAHLVGREELTRLAALDSHSLAASLAKAGYLGATPAASDPSSLDLGLRRRAADWLRALRRWCGERASALTALFEEEDRRSIRRLLRGAVQGASEKARLEGLIPTEALPERALELLAAAPRPRDVASRLIALKSPYGAVLFPEVDRPVPDLYQLESALDRVYAARALDAARHADRHLVSHVRATIDLANAESALSFAREREDPALAEAAFLPGGDRIDRETFTSALRAREPRVVLEHALRHGPLEGALEGEELEASALRAMIRSERDAMRIDPTSTAPVIWFVLSLRAHLTDLARLVWGASLGVPAKLLEASWVTP